MSTPVNLTDAQWDRVMDVLGRTGNDAIRADIHLQLQPRPEGR